jgi:hypothetical protein
MKSMDKKEKFLSKAALSAKENRIILNFGGYTPQNCQNGTLLKYTGQLNSFVYNKLSFLLSLARTLHLR